MMKPKNPEDPEISTRELNNLEDILRILVNKEVNIIGINGIRGRTSGTNMNFLLHKLYELFNYELSDISCSTQQEKGSRAILRNRMHRIIEILSKHKDFPRLLDQAITSDYEVNFLLKQLGKKRRRYNYNDMEKKVQNMTMRVWINEKFPPETVSLIAEL